MNDTFAIEHYIFNRLSHEEKLMVDVRLSLDTEFKKLFDAQKMVYKIIEEYSVKQLRNEIKRSEREVFTSEKFTFFQKKIFNLFNK